MNAVEVTDLTKTIAGHTVLKNITLSLEEHKIYGFIGRNGCGKTMLFRAICGLIHPSAGAVEIFGRRLGQEMSFPDDLGLMIESAGFWENYSGLRNLRTLAQIRKKITTADIRRTLEQVGLNPDDPRPYRKYSLGMKQRLALAQALMEKPRLLVLDEPSNALDEDGVALLRELLLQEKQRGATILLASHNKEDIGQLCDRVYLLREGTIVRTESAETQEGENL